MRFSCTREGLSAALVTAGRAVSQRASTDVLKCILLEACDGRIVITGINADVSLVTSIEACIHTAGSCAVEAKLFTEIIRRMPGETIEFDLDEQYQAFIRSGMSEFSLMALPHDRYPAKVEVTGLRQITLPQALLKKQLSLTSYAVATNDTRIAQMGILFDMEPDSITLVGLDGHRMAIAKRPFAVGEAYNFIVPAGPLAEAERLLSFDEEEMVTLSVDTNRVSFHLGHTEFISKLLEGTFLKYKLAIPEDCPYRTRIGTKELLGSVERVSLIINEQLKNSLRMKFEDDNLQISCFTGLGRAVDNLSIERSEEPLEIGFNYRYIAEALRHCPDDEIIIKAAGPLSAMLILPPEGEEYLFLILPVKLKPE